MARWEKSGNILIIACIAVLAVSAFGGTLSHELVWDDVSILKYIDSVIGQGGLKAVLTSQFATHIEEGYVSGYYRPVPMASLWFDSIISPFFPYQYHLVNILLHGINSVLVFLVFRIFLTRFAAIAGSMIFAVHPVHSESVSFVSGRTDLWATLFVLLSVLLWLRVQRGLTAKPVLERWESIAAFLMACFSKEVAYMLPVVLVLWDTVSPPGPPGERRGWWIRNRSWIYGWIAVLSSLAAMRYIVFGPGWGLIQPEAVPVQHVGILFKLTSLFQIVLMYFRLIILPWPLRVFYSLHELVVTWATVLAVLVLLSLFIFVCRRGRKNASISAAIWLTVFLIPVLLTDHRGGALLAERFLYLPSVGFCLLAGNLADIWPGNRRVLISGLGVLIALMFFGTGIQNRVWKNEIILFTELTRVSPMVSGGYYNLGNAFAEEGRHLEAVTAYRRTVQIDPGHHRAFFNMGNSFRNLGRCRDAVDAYSEALRIDPTLEVAYVNLGVAYMEEGEPKRSIGVYLRGLHYAPEDVRLHIGLVLAYMETGDRSAAEGHYRLLEGKDPKLAGLLKKLLEDDIGGK